MTLFSLFPANSSPRNVAQRLIVLSISTLLGVSAVVIPRLPSQAATTPTQQLPADEPLLLSQLRPRYPYRPRRYRPRPPYRYQTRLRPSRPRIRRPVARRRQSRLPWRPGRIPIRASTYRWGGLARGNACYKESMATALVPPYKAGLVADIEQDLSTVDSQKNNLDFYSTLSERPTFWLYVADLPDTILDFTLQDDKGTVQLYSAEFEVEAGSGIIGVTLPSSVPPLEIGKDAAGNDKAYVWQVRIECDPEDPSKDLYIGSGIRRLALEDVQNSLGLNAYQTWARKIGQANEREQPDLFANIGIWQDALSQLAELRFVAPENQELKKEWEMLLQEAGFQEEKFQNLKAAEVRQIFE